MKKQTISKIAALSLAAITAAPMFTIAASADITTHPATAGSVKNITGTAYRIDWHTTSAASTYKVVYDSASKKFSAHQQVGLTQNEVFTNSSETIGTTFKAAGSVYYGYASVQPGDYLALVDYVNKYNADMQDEYDTFVKAYQNYNTDFDRFETAKTNAKSRTTFFPGTGTGVTTNDATGLPNVGSDSFTDKLGHNIKVEFSGGATNTEPRFKIYIDGTYSKTIGEFDNEIDASDYKYNLYATPSNGLATPTGLDTTNGTSNTITYKKYTVNAPVTTLSMAKLGQDLGSHYVTVAAGTGIIGTGVAASDYYISAGAATDVNDPNETTVSNGSGASTSTSTDDGLSSAVYTTAYPWYSSVTKRYYKTRSDAVLASGGVSSAVTNASTVTVPTATAISSNSAYTSAYHWYSSLTGRYYLTYADAVTASGGYSAYVSDAANAVVSSSTYYSSTYPWYSSLTKKYYKTYSDAVTASGGNSSYVSQGNAYDPYYYYYGLSGLGYSTSTAAKDTSSVTIGNAKGWTSVTKTINSAKSGSTYTVNMQGETEVPSSVLSALKGKNVNINFKLSNGVTYTVNGTELTSTSSMDLYTRTGTSNIPTSLKNKAVKANNGVSSSQLTISNGALGSSTDMSVKFNTKRAGCSAKLYRYNASSNTLTLVSTTVVKSNGQATFDNVKQGGDYIIVLS